MYLELHRQHASKIGIVFTARVLRMKSMIYFTSKNIPKSEKHQYEKLKIWAKLV